MITGMSITRMWNNVRTPPRWSMARFNLHAASTAILADLLAQRLPTNYAEGAFIAGLLHDLGRLLIATGLREEFDEVEDLYSRGDLTRQECERTLLGLTHSELSQEALAMWNIPAAIQTAVRFHHAPERDETPFQSESSKPQVLLSRIVWAANQYSNHAGFSISEFVSPVEKPQEDALESLGLGEDLPKLMDDFNTEFEIIRGFF